jgi:ABC-2 type transport system ATP-binding protein
MLIDEAHSGTPPAAPPAAVIRNIWKRYGDRDALSGVDLIVRHGRLHGLLGPNGAGKTTLMRVALGLVRRDAGNVELLGSRMESMGGPVPEGMAGLVEAAAFYPYLSGRRNLTLLARLDGVDRSTRRQRVDVALAQVGLSGVAEVPVSGYSAGMRQRLGLAGALLRRPRLLLLDEPTSALDPAAARDIRALAQRLAEEGAGIVWSSHDMAEVEDLCADLTVIDRGKVVFFGTADELRALAPASVHTLHSSDDLAAFNLAMNWPGLKVRMASNPDDGLELSAETDRLDAYVIALGRAGVAVRALERRARSLESLFLEITGHPGPEEAREPSAEQGEARATAAAS